jgi:general secretion pathway protein I
MNATRRQAGFSLLEVLVAFVILAIVGTMLSGLYSASLRNAGAAEDWSHATLLAESQLAAAAAVSPLREGTGSGTDADDRFTWTTAVTPYLPTDVPDTLLNTSANLPTRLLRVSVNVTFPTALGASRTITLSTIKMVRKDLP